jgi:hypothetical protein
LRVGCKPVLNLSLHGASGLFICCRSGTAAQLKIRCGAWPPAKFKARPRSVTKTYKEIDMNKARRVALACAGIGVVALMASAAEAQYAQYAPYGYYGPRYAPGTFYSYGADRANPSISPNGWDQSNPRDFQLQGTR